MDRAESIARAVLSDTPQEDFDGQMRKRVLVLAVEAMPPKVRAVYNDTSARHFIRSATVNFGGVSVACPGAGQYEDNSRIKADDELQRLFAAHQKQREARRQLAEKLTANIRGCTTQKVFHERFPDLAKYWPVAAEPVGNLPATTQLIDSLKAAGWVNKQDPA